MTNERLSLHWGIRLTGLATMIWVAASSAHDGSAIRAAEACAIQCGSGSGVNCPSGEHKTWASTVDKNAGGNIHSDCKLLGCAASGFHDCAPIEGDPVAQASEAVASGNTDALNALLATAGARVTINRERLAIQVANSGGQIIAHLPADGALINTVAAETQR